MITIFNRKLLLVDTSLMEVTRVTEKLKQNSIKYHVVTKKSQSTVSNMIHANMSMSVGKGGAASYQDINGNVIYTYFVYVRKNDFENAKNAIN